MSHDLQSLRFLSTSGNMASNIGGQLLETSLLETPCFDTAIGVNKSIGNNNDKWCRANTRYDDDSESKETAR